MSSFAWRQKLIPFVCSWEVVIQIFLWHLLITLKEKRILLFSSIGFLYSKVSSRRQVETSDFPSAADRGFTCAHQIKTFLTAEGSGWYCWATETFKWNLLLCVTYSITQKPEIAGPALLIFTGLWDWPEEYKGPGDRWSPLRNATFHVIRIKAGKGFGVFCCCVGLLVCSFFFIKEIHMKYGNKILGES